MPAMPPLLRLLPGFEYEEAPSDCDSEVGVVVGEASSFTVEEVVGAVDFNCVEIGVVGVAFGSRDQVLAAATVLVIVNVPPA